MLVIRSLLKKKHPPFVPKPILRKGGVRKADDCRCVGEEAQRLAYCCAYPLNECLVVQHRIGSVQLSYSI